MDTITLILSSAALLVSVANFYVIRQMLKEQSAKQGKPDMQTKGAGGGGW
jgi:hypothetical protein